MPPPPVIIRRLPGLTNYAAAVAAMQRFTNERQPDTADEIWLLEHPPVYTLGLNTDPAHLLGTGAIPFLQTDRDGQVLAERNTLGGASDGFAFFASTLRFTVGEMISGTLEVFETSAKDGSEINKVTIPLVLLPGQRVIDLNQPTIGAQVCNPVLVSGYSNTFEAHVAVHLDRRDGTQLALATALGGNLGFYADFSTTISHTVTTPQPVLVGAFEESAAGFGKIDYTRVPIELHPDGSLICP